MDVLTGYLVFSIGFNLILFLLAYFFQTDKITDLSYSLTFAAISIYSFIQSERSLVDIIILLLVIIWAIRLGSYLFYRIHAIGRDKRFDQIRERFISFFLFWLMQGLTCFVVMIPAILINQATSKDSNMIVVIGVIIAISGLLLESVADQQKFKFKSLNPGKFMNSGVWSYLQHPNYTGELLFWWSIFIISLPFSSWYYSIIGPLWISLIIIRFSGISILQKKWSERYGNDPDFVAYSKKTYKLVPFIY
ncbi:MAG: DUF1295 domain-containing protein [Bacteroidia bacterium]|nr:DUF1295 domain-containing protein [Bacteroidia bacterium]